MSNTLKLKDACLSLIKESIPLLNFQCPATLVLGAFIHTVHRNQKASLWQTPCSVFRCLTFLCLNLNGTASKIP